MKKRLSTLLLVLFAAFNLSAQNTNIGNLMSSGDWSSTFPKRAGTTGSHPQGYTTDFFSYANFQTAITEMADYSVSIRKKAGIAGQLSTVTRKGSGTTYEISSVNSTWWSHSGAESTITVDFADFINTSDQQNNKRELAAFLANITKETTGGWQDVGSGATGDHSQWGLYYVQELNSSSCYAQADANYPAVSGKCYYGRGPIQLSWNYNYGQVSSFLYNDKNTLLNAPELVEQDGVLAFKTAIWFWMSPQCPKPSAHQVMHNLWTPATGDYAAGSKMYKNGFAHTNNIINGGLECRTSSSAGFTAKVQLRSDLYLHYLSSLGLSTSDIALENSETYTSTCYSSAWDAMVGYAACDVTQGPTVTCTVPALGNDQTLCSGLITLSAGVTLASGDAIKWYKNDVEISEATSSSYSVSSAGTYKAVISATSCVRSDEVIINQGGSISASVDNDGIFCMTTGDVDAQITVTGGGGFYKLYDASTGGNVVASGGSFTIDDSFVPESSSKTYYVEEPAGQTSTIGLTAQPAADADFTAHQYQNISTSLSYNNYRTAFTASTDITLESIDFEAANLGNTNGAALVVEIYTYGGATLISSTDVDLQNLDFNDWDQVKYTVNIGTALTAGQYEMSITPSNCAIFLAQYSNTSGKNFDFDNFVEAGVASIDGCISPDNRDWGVFKNVNMGNYNWKFSTGGGAAVSCGRVPVTVTHDCTVGVEELSKGSVNVYPNPASDIINVAFNNLEVGLGMVEVINSLGQVVLTQSIANTEGNSVKIQTKGLDGGLYFVKVTAGEKSYSSSVLITK
jgi:hypothetical protein